MTPEMVDKVIELLGAVRDRPALYVGNWKDHSALIHFVHGFYRALGIVYATTLQPIQFGRMYDSQKEMIQAAKPDEIIFKTLADLEIKAWQKFRGELKA
jgi:hypothetical protein